MAERRIRVPSSGKRRDRAGARLHLVRALRVTTPGENLYQDDQGRQQDLIRCMEERH